MTARLSPRSSPPIPTRSPPRSGETCFVYYLANFDAEYKARLASLKELRKQRSGLVDPVAEIMVMKELPQPRPTFVLRRGAYDAPGEPVSRGHAGQSSAVLVRLAAQPAGTGPVGDRPEAAPDRAGDDQPVVAGGLRPGDRGHARRFRQPGPAPLAPRTARLAGADVRDSGWDVKEPLAADRDLGDLPAEPPRRRPSSIARDPDNILLGRGPRFRLPAEMIRDNALAASGLLVGKLGGPPVKPYQPAGLWEEKANISYVRDPGEGSHRRSLYTFWKRTSPPPAMLTFDATSREVCVVKRQPTATPLQALVLMNDPQYVEAARATCPARHSRRRAHHSTTKRRTSSAA